MAKSKKEKLRKNVTTAVAVIIVLGMVLSLIAPIFS